MGRECELVKPDQTVIRVEAELQTDQYSPHLNVSYTLEENEKTNIVHDVSTPSFIQTLLSLNDSSTFF